MELNPSKPQTAKPRDAAGHCREQEPLWPVWLGREGASCPYGASHVHQRISCSSGKAVCSAVPRANAPGGISCRTQGRTKHSLSCFAGAAGSLPGWCVISQTQSRNLS